MSILLAADTVIADRYRLERLLGEGGMGAVWSASHVITRKRVALKFLKGAGAANEQLLKRFLREARAVSAVNHPNVVAVHDIVQLEDGAPVMVMDLLNGESLAERLARVRAMPLAELATALVPIISAVGTAHAAGIVHRDLKPDNIFLHVRADGELEPKVLDFGIAKLSATEGEAAATAHLTQTGALLGTPYYMSPEQVFGEKDIDQRSDVWSMGVILYECLAGKRPIDGENFGQLFKAIATGSITPLEQVAPNVPADVTALVGRMLQVDKKQRPVDLHESYNILQRYSSAKGKSFGGVPVVADATADTERRPQADAPPLAFEATGTFDQVLPGAAQSGAGVFSRTSPDSAPMPVPVRKTWPIVAGIGATVVVLGGGAAWLLRAGPAPTVSSAAPSLSLPAPSAPIAHAATTAITSAPEPEVLPAPSSALAAPSARHVVPPPGPRPAPAPHAAAAPAPAASAAPGPAPAKPAKLPGSVVGDVPF